MNIEAKLNEFLRIQIKKELRKNPQLKDVIVWAKNYKSSSKTVYLGLALGKGTGCSPFCGCAANQLAAEIGKFLIKEFPNDVRAVAGVATLPPDDIKNDWDKA